MVVFRLHRYKMSQYVNHFFNYQKLKPMDIDDRKAIIRDPKAAKKLTLCFCLRKLLTHSEHIFENRGLTPMPEFFRCHMQPP